MIIERASECQCQCRWRARVIRSRRPLVVVLSAACLGAGGAAGSSTKGLTRMPPTDDSMRAFVIVDADECQRVIDDASPATTRTIRGPPPPMNESWSADELTTRRLSSSRAEQRVAADRQLIWRPTLKCFGQRAIGQNISDSLHSAGWLAGWLPG